MLPTTQPQRYRPVKPRANSLAPVDAPTAGSGGNVPKPEPVQPQTPLPAPTPQAPGVPGHVTPIPGAGSTPSTPGPTSENPNGGPVSTVPNPPVAQPPGTPPSGPTPVTQVPPMTPVTQPPIVTTSANLPQAIDPGAPEADVNLRSSVFTPGDDARLMGAQGRTDTAAGRVMDGDPFSTMAQGNEGRYRSIFGTAQDGGKYAAEQDAALAALGGPNRTELATQALKDFDTRQDEQRFRTLRDLKQNFAAAGRLGMGDNETAMLDAVRKLEGDRAMYANDLARSVAEGDINDRFRRVDTTSGLRGQESGIEAGLRDENFARSRSAVDYGGRDAERDINERYDQLGAASDLESRIFGEGASNRDEFRTERDFQQDAAQDSLDNRIRERGLQNSEREQRLSRAIALMQAGGNLSLEQALAMVGG